MTDKNKNTPRKITPRGKFDETKIEYLGDIELTPELDAKIDRMTVEADAEIDRRNAQRQIKRLGKIKLPPEEDAEFKRMIAEVDADLARKAINAYLDISALAHTLTDYYNFEHLEGAVNTARAIYPEFDTLVETMKSYPPRQQHILLGADDILNGYLTGAQGLANVRRPMLPHLEQLVRSGNWTLAAQKTAQVHRAVFRILAHHVAHHGASNDGQ